MGKAPAALALVLLAAGLGLGWQARRRPRPAPDPLAAAAALKAEAAQPQGPQAAAPLLDALRADLHVHRQLIVLFADEAGLQGAARARALEAGHRLHHDRREVAHHLGLALLRLGATPAPQRDPVIAALLDWMEGDRDLLPLDRLAFRDALRLLDHALKTDGSLQGATLRTRLAQDLAEVDRVETQVEAEYRAAFGPGAPPARRRKAWEAYVRTLQARLPLTDLLKPLPHPAESLQGSGEINGTELPDHVLVLSFDDGPHRIYTEEIKTLLQQLRAPALFFQVGRNLGAVDGAGHPRLGPLAEITEGLAQAGFVVGNHSYTHAQLSKEAGAPLDLEIRETDQLLQALPGVHSHLFRFPYGARTGLQLEALRPYGLRSVLWNIDSLDWADPVPASVADRVLKLVAHERRGILLFHDIHDRAGKVLPALIPRLRAEGYRFASLDAEGRLVLPEP